MMNRERDDEAIETRDIESVHARFNVDYTLCGITNDLYQETDKDSHRLLRFVEPGDIVTCPECRKFIDSIRRDYRGHRLVKTIDAADKIKKRS
jgi:hypothetical protein